MKQKVIVGTNFLNSFRRRTGEKQFRQLDYVLVLFLIVTVNKFLGPVAPTSIKSPVN